MKRRGFGVLSCVAIAGALVSALVVPQPAQGDQSGAEAGKILRSAGVTGGLVVHVGCGDGKLTAALASSEKFLVHGLDRSAAAVAKAREYIRSRKLPGRASVELWRGGHLPYVSNTVNLVVVSDPGAVSSTEIMRVLCPGGAAQVKSAGGPGQGGWTRTVKPRPESIDEWTHYMHGADGNAVAADSVVGPPRRVQWRAGPTFGRHHDKLASLSAMVSAKGRLFYIIDEGPASLLHLPPRWRLVARDAFNGKFLWKKPIAKWQDHMRGFRSGPAQLPRRLVAVAGRVYATLGLGAPVTAMDAATGKVVKTYAGTENTDEILLHDGLLLLAIVSPGQARTDDDARRRGKTAGEPGKAVLALHADTGTVAWKKSGPEMAQLQPMTLAAGGQRVCYQVDRTVFCAEARTGREIWQRGPATPARAARPGANTTKKPARRKTRRKPKASRTAGGHYAPTLVINARAGVVLSANAGKVSALSLADGEILWTAACPVDFRAPADLFTIGGLVYPGLFSTKGRDPRTGRVKNVALDDINTLITPGHHPRCYRNMATTNYIITGKHGMEFIDLSGRRHSRNVWVRGGCQFGLLPCNGLVYMPPNACCCYQGALLHGLYALAPAAQTPPSAPQGARLEKGPAYDGIVNRQSSIVNRQNWPTFRADVFRSGAAKTVAPTDLKTLWQVDLGGKLRPPVVADGKVLVPSENEGSVICLDADDGRTLWTYRTAGRIDSPPTIHDGLALFGSADGHVYCVRLTDGKLAWRFRAAPRDLRVVVDDQLESVWPVPGSVLVLDGVAYAAAGRSTYLDGGIYLCGLDVATGRKLYETRYAEDHDKDGASTFAMRGTLCDVLTTDGKWIYLKHVKFSRELVRQEGVVGRHLYADSGLTDDTWFYRTFWKLGYGGLEKPIKLPWSYRKYNMTVPFGQLLVFDEKSAWGLQTKFPSRISGYKPGFWGVKLFRTPNKPFDPDQAKGSDVNDKPGWPPPIKYDWQTDLPFQARAMVMDRRSVFVAGWPDVGDPTDPYAAIEGRTAGLLWVFSREGKKLAQRKLASSPVFDGMAAADKKLYVVMKNGKVACLGAR